jgi:hypothetical protein
MLGEASEESAPSKLTGYLHIASLRGYLIVHPDERWVDHHHRRQDGERESTFCTNDDPIATACAGTILVSDFFIGLSFPGQYTRPPTHRSHSPSRPSAGHDLGVGEVGTQHSQAFEVVQSHD